LPETIARLSAIRRHSPALQPAITGSFMSAINSWPLPGKPPPKRLLWR
jgi:hypothetical protein